MSMASSSNRVVLLLAFAVVLAGCGQRSVDNESRLIEVHGDRAYMCLSDDILVSDPPSCGSDIGTRDNPQLNGRMVSELISVLDGTTQWVQISAREEDGSWFIEGFSAPE